MRTAQNNEGKARGFALAGLLTVALAQGQAPAPALTGTVRGEVVAADGAPAAGVAVSFHAAATLGVAWLRSDAEQVQVVGGTTDARGAFTLEVPVAALGTCLAVRADEVATQPRCLAGMTVRLQLAKAPVRRLTLLGATEVGPLELAFEGASPLANARVATLGNQVAVPRWPGFGAVLLLPPGLTAARTGAPWLAASGADRDRIRVTTVATHPMPVAWLRASTWSVARRGATAQLWGREDGALIGQTTAGMPVALRAGELHVAASSRAANGSAALLPASDLQRVVLVAEHALGTEPLGFTVAHELLLQGVRFELPRWLQADAPRLLLGRDAQGWLLLDATGAPAPAWPLAVHADTLGVSVRLRPQRCRPREVGRAFPGLEVVTAADGAATLPVRLPADRYEWVAMAADGRCASGAFEFTGREALRLELPAGESMHGLVLDADGEPAAGLRVQLLAGRNDVPWSFGWAEHVVHTDAAGEFTLRGLRADLDYEIQALGAASGEVFANGARSGEAEVLLQLRLPAAPR